MSLSELWGLLLGDLQSQAVGWQTVLCGVFPLAAGVVILFDHFTSGIIKAFNLFRISVGSVIGALVAWVVWNGIEVLVAGGPLQKESVITIALSLVGGVVLLAVYYYALFSPSGVRRVLENIFSVPELLGKLAFTFFLLAIYRVGFHVPLPGLDQEAIKEMLGAQSDNIFGQAMQYFSMFTGGSLQRSSLFGLGIMPYISASIIFTLLVNVVPSLEKLQKEGQAGQRKIKEYTRYATVGLCIIQASFIMKWLSSSGFIYPELRGPMIYFVGVLGLTTGTVFLMWLGEQIDEYGIGNGISLLIMAGIVTRLPMAIMTLIEKADFSLSGSGSGIGLEKMIFLVFSFVFVVAGAILITQAQRRIPIQQAKQTRGRKVYGGQRHFLPLRVNHGGVMPIIFASSLMIFPSMLFRWLSGVVRGGSGFWSEVMRLFSSAFQSGSFTYTLVYILMIFFFAYFWTTVNFRPKDMADQLRDMGHFIPGLRPGKRTADYLERVMERITYCGAAFLAFIAVIPTVVAFKLEIPFAISSFLGGTGLLIMVSVTLDLVQRIEANLVMRNYGGFLGDKTRIKGAHR